MRLVRPRRLGPGIGVIVSRGQRTIADYLGENGAWWDFRDGALLTTATQPDNTNSDFSLWTGAYPDETPTGWTKAPAVGTANDYVANAAGSCKLYSTTALVQLNKAGIAGCRYRMTLDVSSLVSGELVDNYNSTTPINVPGSHIREYTDTGLIVGLKRWGYPTDATFTNLRFANRSVTSAAAKVAGGTLAGGTLAQATPANMGYIGTGIVFDGTEDHYVSSLAAAAWALHKAAGFTLSRKWTPASGAAGTDTIIDTCNVTGTNVGVTVEYDAANQQVVVKVANGAGFIQSTGTGAGTVTKGALHTVSVSWSEAAGVTILVDAAAAVTAASGGAASAADATATLQVGRTSGGANFDHGDVQQMLVRIGALSSTDLAALHALMRAA